MVQKNVTKFNELLITISEYLLSNQFNLIAIDGYDHEGKSSLAKKISSNLEITIIELDTSDYLQKNNGGYIDWIKYDHLKEELEKSQRDNKSIIVEGICVLEILKKINFSPSIHIYTKKLIGGKWPKDKYLDFSKNLNELISKEEEEIDDFNNWLNDDERVKENIFTDQIDISEMGSKIDESSFMNNSKKDKVHPFSGIHRELLEYHFKYKPNEIAQIVFTWEKT